MVGIVNLIHQEDRAEPGKVKKWQEIGTAPACEFHGAKVLLTAKHVLDGAGSADLAFLVRPTGRIEWANEPHRTRFERIPLDIDRILRCEWEDIAAIVLKAEGCNSINVRFCQLPQKFVDQTSIAEVVDEGATLVHNLTARSSAFWGQIVARINRCPGLTRSRTL